MYSIQTMKLFKVLPLVFSFFLIEGFAQAPVGGASLSAFVCIKGHVYDWGLNQQGPTGSIV